MNVVRRLIMACMLFGGLGAASTLWAADSNLPDLGAAKPASQLVQEAQKRDAVCTKCHDESEPAPVLSIAKTKHGVHADARTPSCQSCHGESEKHLKGEPGAKSRPAPDVVFKKGAYPVSNDKARSDQCVTCHQKDAKRMFWEGSQHASKGVACNSCHLVHTDRDVVREKRTQPEVCYACHKEQRAQANKPSHHPIPEGKMTCSDCHNVHGTTGTKLLTRDSTTDTCYQCHAEKRGPYLWAHQPVTDDCSNCHNPHGTTADSMLKTRAPFLCLSCHDPASHPGNVPGVAGNVNMRINANGNVLSSSTPPDNYQTSGVVGKTQGMACMNCHQEIHGSNNPMNSTRSTRFWR